MVEDIELCADYCPEDCMYRSYIDGGNAPICFYAAMEHQLRGCKISECNRYKPGRPIRPRIREEYFLMWEYLIYEHDADSVW